MWSLRTSLRFHLLHVGPVESRLLTTRLIMLSARLASYFYSSLFFCSYLLGCILCFFRCHHLFFFSSFLHLTFVFSFSVATLFLSSDRQHLSYDDRLKVKGEYYQNCCVLCCVWQLCTTACTPNVNQFLNLCLFRLKVVFCVSVFCNWFSYYFGVLLCWHWFCCLS